MKKNNLKNLRGFTVLELLIVIAMMVLLMGMVLVGLNNSRKNARDQERISNIKRVQIGLSQFYQVCGHYPPTLAASSIFTTATCPALGSGTATYKTFKDFVSDITSLNFNSTGSRYKYVSLTYVSGGSGAQCSGYHIGVDLEETSNALATKDSQFNSAALPTGIHTCNTPNPNPFNGTTPGVYDAMVNY